MRNSIAWSLMIRMGVNIVARLLGLDEPKAESKSDEIINKIRRMKKSDEEE